MPLDTILLVDTSGSMAGRGIRELKRACTTFMDGVEETARELGLKENVGIVEFNSKAQVLQSLTNDYRRCRRAIDTLKATGRTAMFDGLMAALKEIIENGGVLRVAGIPMTPRIILMTDGKPTDEKNGEEEAQKDVLKAAMGFGPGWRITGLPHPVPIACVGCGDCDPSLLEAVAKITKGMFVIVENMSELSTFFRRQVLLIRFAAKFASDMERLRSQIALAAFLRELGEAVEEAEVAAMQRLLLAMLHMSVDDDDDDEDDEEPQASSGALAIASGPSRATPSLSLAPTHRYSPSSSNQPVVQQTTRVMVQRRVVVASRPGNQDPSRSPPSGSGQERDEGADCTIQ